MAQFTVDSLLTTAHRPRTRHPSHVPGHDMDHIVELQLVVAALNRIPQKQQYVPDSLGKLVDFFNAPGNMQLLPTGTNRTKGQEVTLYIMNPSPYTTTIHIRMIAQKWIELRAMLPNFELFKREMNAILQVAP
jgi:hypothetical protein